jgi:hypothetical protein
MQVPIPNLKNFHQYRSFLISIRFHACGRVATYLGVNNNIATFHLFVRLPAELRLLIWELTVEPRTVEVRIIYKEVPPNSRFGKWQRVPLILSSTPVSATLQTSQEARNHGLYQCAFYGLAVSNGAPSDSERRYVWLNLDIDFGSIGKTRLECFGSVAPTIKRLQLARDGSEEHWERWEIDKLRQFIEVEEIHVISESGWLGDWYGASEHYWPCGNENVFITNPEDGEILNIMDMKVRFDRVLEEEYRLLNNGEQMTYRNGHQVHPDDD